MQKNFSASNEGMVAVDPKTGQILAMVGSRGYFDPTIDGKVNVTLSSRQPGSSFKPFVYATAFEKGYTPDTIVFDLKTQFSTYCKPEEIENDTPPCYSPDNFDGTFKGPMNLRNAIAQSENIPAIKVLYLAGVKDSITTAKNMGITTLGDANRYGLTLVLGGGEVNLLEMTSAYGVFGNDGVKNPPVRILRVEDIKGNILEQYEYQSTRVLDPQIARLINNVLSDNVARTPEFGSNSPLYFSGVDVADKTGTTNDYRDVWILGYTPGISVGAWAGNNNNTPMEKKIAAFIIAPMWHEFMDYAIKKYPTDGFISPAPDAHLSSFSPVLQGNWNSNPNMGVHDILYWINKDDPRGGPPANPANDSQFAYWEYPVQLWAAQNPTSLIPIDSVAQQPAAGTFTITSPEQNTVIPWGTNITTHIETLPGSQITNITYYVNGAVVGNSSQAPYAIPIVPNGHGAMTLRAVAKNEVGSYEEKIVVFVVQ
ncbi:MAG: Penicillin-binding protein [Candidatus Kaiserbacteria bacterium GW2011_GWC2_52_8b]|nr:MAG: Penicillin-binding protein [Candidatus Kaiserbacteria bacterium GW2011_GWC2_52_8b]